jgi:hypothetical protein
MVPDAAREALIMAEARRAAERVVAAVATRAQAAAGEDAGTLAEAAGHELENYSRSLLTLLVSAAGGCQEPACAAWVRCRFHEFIGEVGSALRDAVQAPEARHVVAQTLQRKVLEAEDELRAALGAPSAP